MQMLVPILSETKNIKISIFKYLHIKKHLMWFLNIMCRVMVEMEFYELKPSAVIYSNNKPKVWWNNYDLV